MPWYVACDTIKQIGPFNTQKEALDCMRYLEDVPPEKRTGPFLRGVFVWEEDFTKP